MAVLSAAFALVSTTARSEDAEPRSADEPATPAPASPGGSVVPPVPIDTSVLYPAGAAAAAAPVEVVLELLVDAEGRVASARAIDGVEPFATAARDAAARWQFRPATRDGRPVAARLRFVVRFRPPSPAPSEHAREAPAASPPPAVTPGTREGVPPPAAASGADKADTEVIVRGTRVAPGGVALSRAEVRAIPGALGDPFRAIDAVGGVTPVASGVPYFFIRGAPPGNIGYFLDGIRIPLLFHIFLGPSVVHPSLIEQVELYRGAAPARFGRFSGAIVAADLAEPQDRLRGEVTVRAFDAGGIVETPFAGGRGHAMIAGRYSYTAAVASLFSHGSLGYWDYQGLVSYDVGRRDRIGVFAFGADDRFQLPGQDLGAPQSHRLDLRYDHRFAGGSLRTAVAFGEDLTGNFLGESRDRSVAPRIVYKSTLGEHDSLEIGADASIDKYTFDLLIPTPAETELAALFPSRTDAAEGAHASLTFRPAPSYSFTPGLRVDHFSSDGEEAWAVEPRVAGTFEVAPSVRAVHTLGLAHQSPNFVPGVPAVHIAGLAGGLQKSLQASSGVEADLPEDMTASFTVFDNIYWNLVDPLGIAGDVFAHPETASIRAIGNSFGAELFIKRSLSRKLGGFLSYTISRTTRSHDRIHTLASIDRTHVLNAAVGYDVGRNWRLGARGVFTSGVPGQHVTFEGHVYDGYGRAPPFFRLDLRVEKRWILSERAYIAFTAELFNATFSAEAIARTCGGGRCANQYLGPVTIPSVGVEAAF